MRRRPGERTASEAGRSVRSRAGQEGLLASPVHYCIGVAVLGLLLLLPGAACAEDIDSVDTSVARPVPQVRLFSRPAKRDVPFSLTLYLKDAEGQKVWLALPPGLQLVEGSEVQRVRTEPGKKFAVVIWKVTASKVGDYKIKAILPDGTTAEEEVQVYVKGGFD